MTYEEISLQLTLAAINTNKGIRFLNYDLEEKEDIESQNDFNAKQIADFYNTILTSIETQSSN